MSNLPAGELEICYEEGVKRFSNKEELYKKYLVKFVNEKSFFAMKDAFCCENYELAFQYAHTLKGLSGNLSLNLLYQKLCLFVEDLRHECNIAAAQELYPDLEKTYLNTIEAIKKYI